MGNEKKRIEFYGKTVYPGNFYTKCLKIGNKHSQLIYGSYIHDSESILEIYKFKEAFEKSKIALKKIIKVNKNKDKELYDIFFSQLMFLEDPVFYKSIIKGIEINYENTILSVQNSVKNITEKFKQVKDPKFLEKIDHLTDVSNRIIKNYLNQDDSIVEIKEDVIILAKELSPSELILLDKTKIKGIVLEHGGLTSHVSIIARNYGIAMIVGVPDFFNSFKNNEYVFLNAEEGKLIKNPNLDEIKNYGSASLIKQKSPKKKQKQILKTKDGTRIILKVNFEIDSNMNLIHEENVNGIGLFRSESLFLRFQDGELYEEEQFQIYKNILDNLKNLPFVIRAFDIGGDKSDKIEDNPFLGRRGIRYLLANLNLFKEQLRAVLRASAFGNVSLLLPMIISKNEINQTKKLINDAKEELRSKKIKFNDHLPIGIMLETPSVCISYKEFVKEVDFFSIGSNDLVQYTLAVDRTNEQISDLYNPLNFSVLKLIINLIIENKKFKKPISICGEAASDSVFLPILLLIGIREISIPVPMVRKTKELIENFDLKTNRTLLNKILEFSKNEEYTKIQETILNLLKNNLHP